MKLSVFRGFKLSNLGFPNSCSKLIFSKLKILQTQKLPFLIYFKRLTILFGTSNDQTCFTNFSQFVLLKTTTFHWTKLKKKDLFWTNIFFLFQLLNWEKTWKKLGKTRLVVWWIDVTNKPGIHLSFSRTNLNKLFSRVFLRRQILIVNYHVRKLVRKSQ